MDRGHCVRVCWMFIRKSETNGTSTCNVGYGGSWPTWPVSSLNLQLMPPTQTVPHVPSGLTPLYWMFVRGWIWAHVSAAACPDHCQRCTVNADGGTVECDADKCDPGYGLKDDDKTCVGKNSYYRIIVQLGRGSWVKRVNDHYVTS